jgi:hypothetical protein
MSGGPARVAGRGPRALLGTRRGYLLHQAPFLLGPSVDERPLHPLGQPAHGTIDGQWPVHGFHSDAVVPPEPRPHAAAPVRLVRQPHGDPLDPGAEATEGIQETAFHASAQIPADLETRRDDIDSQRPTDGMLPTPP